jgi:hypothetical protein
MKKENLSRRIIEKIVREELSNIIEGEICDKGISYVIRTDPGGKDIKRGKDKDGDGKGDLQNWSARAAQIASKYCKDPDYGKGRGKDAKDENLEEDCWDGYERVPGSKEDAPGSCRKKTNEELEDDDKEELNTITGELAKASKMHKGQSDRIKKIAKKVKVEEGEGGLKAWEKENWTHSDGTPCGGGKKDGSKSRCKPASKWKTMSKGEKSADNRKKAKGTKAGEQYVSATEKGKVTKKHTKRTEESIEEVEYKNPFDSPEEIAKTFKRILKKGAPRSAAAGGFDPSKLPKEKYIEWAADAAVPIGLPNRDRMLKALSDFAIKHLIGNTDIHTFKPMSEDKIEEIEYNYIPAHEATYDDGNPIDFILEFWDDVIVEAEYQGRKVTLNKPMQGDVKKFKVYVKDPKTKNVKKVNFGDPNMRIKKSNPKRRKAFRDRHNCKEKMKKGDKTTAGYWSCKKW